jgi:hypothetical protein
MASSTSEFTLVQGIQQTAVPVTVQPVTVVPITAAQMSETAWHQQMLENGAGQTKANYFSELRQDYYKL